MKGHMQDGKFHPHIEYKGVRKSRDQQVKTQGIKIRKERIFQDDPDAVSKLEVKLARLEKEKAYWKGLKSVPRTYQANEPDGAKRSFMLPNLNANIRTVRQKIELIKGRQEKNIGLERKTTFKNGRKVFYYEEVEKKKRDPHIKGKKLPKEVVQGAKDDLGGTDVEVENYNPKWKLYEVYVDSDRYYFFPDEESAIKFGRQSIRDTASEYIPDEGSPNRAEYINLSDDDLVEKIIEEASEYGQRSELGAIAQSVASADGQYHELPDGWIAFQID